MVTRFAYGSIKKTRSLFNREIRCEFVSRVFRCCAFLIALFFAGDASMEKQMPTKLLRLTPPPPFARFLPMAFGKASVSL